MRYAFNWSLIIYRHYTRGNLKYVWYNLAIRSSKLIGLVFLVASFSLVLKLCHLFLATTSWYLPFYSPTFFF
ncbi:hypothetical protein DMA11_20825 [Marinilabiliaceae bacterium JC017]|nr:hypothetical protein DMA11_20825 [Marinilabiliaceae bacterium JC017]